MGDDGSRGVSGPSFPAVLSGAAIEDPMRYLFGRNTKNNQVPDHLNIFPTMTSPWYFAHDSLS